MLTKTQLRVAKTKELETLQERISQELESRREEAAQERQPDDAEQRFSAGHKGSYRWEYAA